ncbi:molecular chaperone DnaK [Myxococcota bacterium]|nr:molecular chaperone DnaK [Myxococcota bacterium]
MGRIIGIDLGTTNSVAACMEGREPRIIINEEGGRLTPSVVGFSRKRERFVGDVAKRQMLIYPESTIYGVKRLIGRRYGEAQAELSRLAFRVAPTGGDEIGIEVDGHVYSPQQIASFILSKIRKSAEDFLGEPVTEAIVTVPAYFNDRQRQATKDAGRIAGLDVLRIINEPTAAALAYLTQRKKSATIAVYDFGGGTFDISILDVDEDVAEVRATCGNTHLGGSDIDNRVVDWLLGEFKKANGVDVSGDKMVRQRLLDAAERAKMELSTALETEIHLPFLTADEAGPRHLQTVLTRSTFEYLVDDLLTATIDECEKALNQAKCAPEDVDEVILVGGSSRIPKIQAMVKALFQRPLNKQFNPDEVVAIGAAIQAGVLGGEVSSVTLLDVTNFTLGIEVEGRRFAPLIPKNSTVPVVRSQLVSTVVDSQRVVKIHVLQGEGKWVKDNVSLGEFELTNVEPAPRGVPRIEVTFTIDTDGIVNVNAQDIRTGAQNSIVIHSPTSMTQDQVDESRRQIAAMDAGSDEDAEGRRLREEVEQQLYGLESFLRAHKLRLKKKDIFDGEQALKRGRMALVKKAKAESLRELQAYLTRFHGHISEKISAGTGVAVGVVED